MADRAGLVWTRSGCRGHADVKDLSAFLALNGALVLLFCSMIGLLLAKALHEGRVSQHWHLLHAGGTSRGILLLALAAAIEFAGLPHIQLAWATGLVVFFVWTSVLAMFLRALTEEKGFHPGGSRMNKAVFLLYASGTVALPVGLVWLSIGFAGYGG